MKSKFLHPKWIDLYLMIGAFMGALWLAVRAPLSDTNHTLVEAGLLILLYLLINRWIGENEAGLIGENYRQFYASRTGELPAEQPSARPAQPAPAREPRPALRWAAGLSAPAWLAAILAVISNWMDRWF